MISEPPTAYVNARLLDPDSGLDSPGALLAKDGAIADFGPELFVDGVPEGIAVVDCGGHCMAPGLIDMHVHFREPGHEHKETIATGGLAAAAGGGDQRRLHAQHQARDRRRGADRVRAAPRARGQGGQGLSHWCRDQGAGRAAAHRDGHAGGGRRGRLLRRRPPGRRQPGDAPRAQLRAHLRLDREPACGRPLALQLRLHGGGRDFDSARLAGHPRRIGDRGRRARHSPGGAHRRPLPRGAYLNGRRAGCCCAAPSAQACR